MASGRVESGASGNKNTLSIKTCEPEEPIPDFCFFSGVSGKSRIKSEFEQLQFLGKGGFGNVIKVYIKLEFRHALHS